VPLSRGSLMLLALPGMGDPDLRNLESEYG